MGDMSWFRSLTPCSLGISYDDLQDAPVSNIDGNGVIIGQLTTGVYSISGTWKLTEDDRERQTPDDDLFYILNDENGTRATLVSSVGVQTIYVPKDASITDVVMEGPPDYLELVQKNQKQPDWNQNDDTQPDYVKNRPFYTGDPVETALVEELTATFTAANNGLYSAQVPSTFMATVGEPYKVYWDGSVYECTCVDLNGELVLGNLSIPGAGSDTGEPFVMAIHNGQGILVITADTSDSHTFSISGFAREVVKLDEKYLPENIATKSEVEAAQTAAATAQTAADAAQTAADAALAKFPPKYSDVVDTPFSAVEVPGEVTAYSRSSVNGGTFIKLVINSTSDLTGSGFYKVSSDVFDFEDIYKISYKFKYSSGASGNLISVDDLEPKVIFSSDHSVFLINRDILFCGSTGTFTITINRRTQSFSVAETGIYSYTSIMSSSHSFVNYIKLTKKVSGFIQSSKPVLIPSSTEGSTKKFRITVDDSGLVQFVDKDTGSVYGTMVPAVTAEDDGKFLRVRDGQWAAVAITNAEEVSF